MRRNPIPKIYLGRAKAAGREINASVYPWRVRQTPGADPHTPEAPIVRTDLEAQLAKALEEVEQEGRDEENHATCPSCAQPVKYWPSPNPGLRHHESCKLAAALKAFRGES